MIEELIFTSSRKGLQAGKSGFCTVACTPGMSAPLVRFLESLSGYRHLYPPGTEQAKGNPVVYANLKTKVGGRSYQILSRVGDAGLDYSNRSNKIAHHLAIQDTSDLSSGPCEILSKPEILVSQWDRPSAKLQPRSIGVAANPPTRCQTWETVTGDAGWAGEVIEGLEENRAIYLIVAPNTPALSLLKEVLALLPKHKQWQTTFSTFFTKLPPNVECDIRCVIAGSPEATAARRSQSNLVLDLTAPLGAASNVYAEMARSGQILEREDESFADSDPLLEIESEQESDVYDLEPDGAFAAGPPKLNAPSGNPITTDKKDGSRKWIRIGGVGVCVALALALIAPFVFPSLGNQIVGTETEVAEVVPDENKSSPDDDESAMEMTGSKQPGSVDPKAEAEAEAEAAKAKANAVVTVAIAKAVADLAVEAAAKASALAEAVAERVRAAFEEGRKIKVKDLNQAVDLNNFLGYLNAERKSRPERINLIEIGEKHRFGNVAGLVFKIEKQVASEDSSESSSQFEIIKSNATEGQEWSIYYHNGKPDSYKKIDHNKVGVLRVTNDGIVYFEWSNNLNRKRTKDAFEKLSKSDLVVICNDGREYTQSLRKPRFFSAVVKQRGNELKLIEPKSIYSTDDRQSKDFPWEKLNYGGRGKLAGNEQAKSGEEIIKLEFCIGGGLPKYDELKPYFPRVALEIYRTDRKYRFVLINNKQNVFYNPSPPTSDAIFEAMIEHFQTEMKKIEESIRRDWKKKDGDEKDLQVAIDENKKITDFRNLEILAREAKGKYDPVEEALEKFSGKPVSFSAEERKLYLFLNLEKQNGEGRTSWDEDKMKAWYKDHLENKHEAGK